jgi:hypothetical protein
MKKNSRAHIANPGPPRPRALRLSREIVRVLSEADLARAAGGSNCDSTSFTTEHTRDGGVAARA